VQLLLVARCTLPPTLIGRGGLVLSLPTGEILPRDVVIHSRHATAIIPCDHYPAAPKDISAHGKFVSPRSIDDHIHVEYTKLVPGELARLSIPKGTTTILADVNCIANVFGGQE
jgi:adenine deaminase